MKLKFDSSQPYQLTAISSIVDLFDGQPLSQGDFSIELTAYDNFGQKSLLQTELGTGNNLLLSDESILKNLQRTQEKNDLDHTNEDEFKENALNFSVEMETGTGKTYVYLRTIFELSHKYGFKKFIVVVPSVAIREGALKNIEITKDHFKALYNNIEFEYFVYDSRKANRLRQFATSNQLQIMIINIDAFRKDFSDDDDSKKSNVIFKESDKLSGRKPIEFVQAARPFVIIDEPQSVDGTPKAQEAIKSLNPLCIFRYSATHKNVYNLVHKLDPIKAYELRLVKQIVVASVEGVNAQNDAYIKLLAVDNKKGIQARIAIHENTPKGPREKKIWVKQNADLYVLSNERENYRNGFQITDISAEPGNEYIDFTLGRLMLGQERGGVRNDLMEVQIRNTIKRHLDKELQLKGKGIKVLSLFFIDRVSNYREYDAEGRPVKGKFAQQFEKHYQELIKQPQYKELDEFSVDRIHDGYFSQDKKGAFKDTSGSTKDDDDTYAKIMQNKEQLLSNEEPLKFIFSHSALREGWDNPNVFQICTLNESRSAMKKRQEIGRGLRLPVNQNGERVFDDNINKLLIIANESYEDFARALQTEYEDDCGVTFGKIPKIGFSNLIQKVEAGVEIGLGRIGSEKVWTELAAKGFIDASGKITKTFTPQQDGFSLGLSDDLKELEPQIIDLLQSYQLNRHIKRDEEPKRLKINKQVFLDSEFENLWNKIKHKTTYEVKYSTEELVSNSIKSIRRMEKVEAMSVSYREAQLDIDIKGITSEETRVHYLKLSHLGGLPDIIAYIQRETELTRKTIVEILKGSGRLEEFAINPQKFMDAVSGIIKIELHKVMIDGVQYNKIAGDEWRMTQFEDVEILSYLHNRLEVKNSIYDAVVYDSEVERKFADDLDKRDDIKLFVKLPRWFQVETPVGFYNPDWAIVKEEDVKIYLVRETKATKDFEKLRNSEADKVKCGRKHFDALGVDFDVVTSSVNL
ncbi:MAG: DEAD/DEAH box helicase family protein [Cyclobacteriaceae bacterium]|nr:DEAD/DEAH box helicase family protein [Cyclobacteriaceae bacterium]